MLADPATLNPLYARDSYAREIALLTEPTLLRLGRSGGMLPYLAQSVQGLPGGQAWIFRLNPAARWSSGQPITAQDVVATFEAAALPTDRTPYQGLLANLSSVTVMGREAVRLTFRARVADGLERLGLVPILPASVVRPRLGHPASLAEWNPVTAPDAITGGPYRALSGSLATGRLTFVARPGFWLPLAGPGRIVLQYEFTTAGAWAAFLDGKLSVATVPGSDRAAAARLARKDRVTLLRTVAQQATFVAFNLYDPILASSSVREAIWLSVPASRIARSIGEVPTPFGPSPWVPGVPLAGSKVSGPNVAKARALLRAAGWHASPNTPFLTRDGHTLSFTCVTVTGVPGWDGAISQVVESLARVGINMNVTYLPFRTLAQMLARPGGLPPDFGAYALAFAPAPGSGVAALYGGAATFPPAGADAGGYSNPVVTRILVDGEEAPAVKTRGSSRLALRLARALAADPPAVFLGMPRATLAVAASARMFFVGRNASLAQWWAGEGDLG